MEINPEVVYPTRILTCRWPDSRALNEELKAVILEKAEYTKGITRSNAARCWHSENTLLDWGHPCTDQYREMLRDAMTAMASEYGAIDGSDMRFHMSAWAMVSGKGDYANPHTHPNCHWSSAYYVSVGDQKNEKVKDNGCIEFIEPRGGINNHAVPGLDFNPRVVMEPQEGYMVVFPSWLRHWVHPFLGKGNRICIAANCRVDRYAPKRPSP